MTDDTLQPEIHALFERAAALRADIEALASTRAGSVDGVRVRLSIAADALHAVERELTDTTVVAIRQAQRDPATACHADWGVCPEHGPTLTSSAGESWCKVCGTRWPYDRLGDPCAEPATVEIDGPGRRAVGKAPLRLCAAHGRDAQNRIVDEDMTITPIGPR